MSNESAHSTHNVEDIGEFRARRGTAVSELAGAAEYWSKRAKAAEEALSKRQWGYFWGGSCITVIAVALTIVVKGFFFR